MELENEDHEIPYIKKQEMVENRDTEAEDVVKRHAVILMEEEQTETTVQVVEHAKKNILNVQRSRSFITNNDGDLLAKVFPDFSVRERTSRNKQKKSVSFEKCIQYYPRL